MVRVLSSLSHLVLLLGALALGLAAPVTGVMAGTGAAVGQMVLCTGTGPLTVWVDAQGQPLPAPDHPCPKCHGAPALSLLPEPAGEPQALAPQQAQWHAPGRPLRQAAVFHGPEARAPPIAM